MLGGAGHVDGGVLTPKLAHHAQAMNAGCPWSNSARLLRQIAARASTVDRVVVTICNRSELPTLGDRSREQKTPPAEDLRWHAYHVRYRNPSSLSKYPVQNEKK